MCRTGYRGAVVTAEMLIRRPMAQMMAGLCWRM
jgi:hypothetical protein